MNPLSTPAGNAVELTGSPFERGRQQAERCPDMVAAVRHAVDLRMAETEAALAPQGVRDYIEDLRRFHLAHDSEVMEEVAGIGAGFEIPAERLFDYLMLSLVADLDPPGDVAEECTAFAATDAAGAAIVAKNRDYRGEHVSIQRVFLHRDPDWGGREVLCVGSLGSPGNFSSGANSDGFALADTASRTTAHGVGRHRYFLLTRLQTRCATVAEALGEIAATPHAGGGLLVMGDSTGCMATVELGHNAVAVEIRHRGWVERTNHYIGDMTAGLNRRGGDMEANIRNSEGRLPTLRGLLEDAPRPMTVDGAAGVLSYRGEKGGEALCRWGGKDISQTISGSVYDTGGGRLWFAKGNPSAGDWTTHGFATAGQAGRAAE